MATSRVTEKFQVTIPKEIRERVGLKAGEEVLVEALSDSEIVIRRFPRVADPLKVLIGQKPVFDRHIEVEEFEERAEEP